MLRLCDDCNEWVPAEELNEDNICDSCYREAVFDEDMGDIDGFDELEDEPMGSFEWWDDGRYDEEEEEVEVFELEDIDESGVDWDEE